ncbi:Polyketide cyclase/dehydrase [Segniliparus rotundus DSM 44985]|uniref:Polyketide cyclase/dehydrase n=1 Tax=Segniliparus rotundus (strain ATCC BAA-972 / CDC 1076 / CIP 108378 / DSM 44985 / JCM 13578) TaxID=640132 RepID=D6Z968_SEGRD|nr:SRPBCC family protein [Segniliparus rotundus]ADG98498.1 Polyketide cyclase/dehydrase [Segniliparus rotundus DSM 44985]
MKGASALQNVDPQYIFGAALFFVGVLVLALIVVAALAALLARGGPASSGRFLVQRVDRPDVDRYFAKRAMFSTTVRLVLPLGPEKVWRALMADEFLSWLPTVRGHTYRSDSREEGARRTLRTFFVALEEQFVVVEPEKTLVYSIIGSSLPGLRDLTERFVLEPVADGGTQLEWTTGFSLVLLWWLPVRWTAPFVRPFLKLALSGLRHRI